MIGTREVTARYQGRPRGGGGLTLLEYAMPAISASFGVSRLFHLLVFVPSSYTIARRRWLRVVQSCIDSDSFLSC